jgi:alpha-1,3/alpha-1,6-mannosyltransferase
MADDIVVNSKFTAGVFKESFKSLSNKKPGVLYPSIVFSSYDRAVDLQDPTVKPLIT